MRRGLDPVVWYRVDNTRDVESLGGGTMKPLTIGQVAHQAGIGVETVRFYERNGLLKEPDRKASGYRQYGEDVVPRLRFIRRAKELGFTLKEIADLLALRHDPAATRSDVRRKVQSKIADVEARVRDLQRIKEVLRTLVDTCHGPGPADDCPILRAIDQPDEDHFPSPNPSNGTASGTETRQSKGQDKQRRSGPDGVR
jgi:MerR family transcriptional regulator, copper efflux regulator